LRKISRREFVRLCGMSTAGLGLMSVLGPQISQTLVEAAESKVPVIWIQASSCTGCSVSLLNSVEPGIATVLLDVISMRYHPNVMAASGELGMETMYKAADRYAGEFILVVEGGVPTAEKGRYCIIGDLNHKEITAVEAVKHLGSRAKLVVAAGQCASFGGIPAAQPNPTGVLGVDQILNPRPYPRKHTVVNISNCPIHPDHLIGSLVYILTYNELPELDQYYRPKLFYGPTIHDTCFRRPAFDEGVFAKQIGDYGCLANLGCKGFIARSDCQKRGWNNNVSWCIAAGAPCQACSEPIFPDGCSPLYGHMPVTGNRK